MRYVFGGYEVDTQRHELRHRGIPCPLESQAFQMLVYCVQHRDRVVSKAELRECLWPQQYIIETTLSQRLRLVRKAVGDSGRGQRVITTVPGHGYQFVATVKEQTEIPPATAYCCLLGLRPCRPKQRGGRTSWRPR
jgi:DNA-binding winged helix-turn-helix (wHTH) protein